MWTVGRNAERKKEKKVVKEKREGRKGEILPRNKRKETEEIMKLYQRSKKLKRKWIK